MTRENPIRTTTGRIAFVDPTTMVYVPFRNTRDDAVQALRDIYLNGITRPLPGVLERRERVYPIDYAPGDKPHTYHVVMRNDDAEVVEATLTVVFGGERAHAGPRVETETPSIIDPFEL